MEKTKLRILRINLSTQKTSTEYIDSSIWENFYGGRGLGIRMLYDEVGPRIDPLSPESKLIFTTSPLVGTLTPGANKLVLTFKSPLTSGCFVSLCGGTIAPELRFTGHDVLIIEGKSEKPIYLFINNDEVFFRDASDIWGQFTHDTDRIIKEKEANNKLKIAYIGPAGERLVRFACIQAERSREFGRGGGGAILGSKMLKAIAIKGTQPVEVKNNDFLKELASRTRKALLASPKGKIRNEYGTQENAIPINSAGFWPVCNFSKGVFDKIQDVDMYKLKEFVVRKETCYGCPIACGKMTSFQSSDGMTYNVAPEFESISMLGPNLGISSFSAILELCLLCDLYGMDTISTGTTISMALEAISQKLIDEKVTDGLLLNFGAEKEIFQLVRKIGRREGIGNILAEGTKIAARKLGVPDLAMEVKGLGLPAYDPRGAKGMGLAYATAAEGASHMRSPVMFQEIGTGTRLRENGKAEMVIESQIAMAIIDSLCLCSSMRFVLSTEGMLDFLKASTGVAISLGEANKAGRRILTLERLYNNRGGFGRKDDYLPKRFLKEPLLGPSEGSTVNLEIMLTDYYQKMGWDNHGVPKKETLKELSL